MKGSTKICRQKMSIMFNEKCIYEEMLHIYIYTNGVMKKEYNALVARNIHILFHL